MARCRERRCRKIKRFLEIDERAGDVVEKRPHPYVEDDRREHEHHEKNDDPDRMMMREAFLPPAQPAQNGQADQRESGLKHDCDADEAGADEYLVKHLAASAELACLHKADGDHGDVIGLLSAG